MLQSDLSEALEQLEKAGEKLAAAADDLCAVRPEVVQFLEKLPASTTLSLQDLATAQVVQSGQIGAMMGAIRAQLSLRKSIHETFTGVGSPGGPGRSPNWIAEFVAMKAAEIYRTAFPGAVARSSDKSRPSFIAFLERFSATYPDAERADKRKLARLVWDRRYQPEPFAPID